jgi:hypothetical protein
MSVLSSVSGQQHRILAAAEGLRATYAELAHTAAARPAALQYIEGATAVPQGARLCRKTFTVPLLVSVRSRACTLPTTESHVRHACTVNNFLIVATGRRRIN